MKRIPLLVLAALTAATAAAVTQEPGLPSRPSWLTELSFTARESWESNVFLTNTRGPVGNDIANRPSMITALSPKIALDFAPLLEGSVPDFKLKHLSLSYSPEIVRYHDQPGENYDTHRIGSGVQASWSDFSFQADNLLSIVDGSHTTPQYTGRSSIATGIVRERRDQIQDRLNLQMRYNGEGWFFRPVASLLYYDLQTDLRVATGPDAGWQNYADRYDLNGGADAGFKILPDFYLTSGYRHGTQHQGNLFSTPSNSSNEYDRLLFGWEGHPLAWLKTQAQIGPDFRTFGEDRPLGHESNKNFLYFDGSVSADLTAHDSISIKAKQWEWVSGSGTNSYQDTSISLAYKHSWSPALETGTELKWNLADYDDPSAMNDTLYTLHEDLGWKISSHTSLHADYSFSRAQDMTEKSTASSREYANHQVSLSFTAAY